MHQITLFQDKKSPKNYLGRGHTPSPDPSPSEEGRNPLPKPYSFGAYGA